MADNSQADAGAGGDIFATDDIAAGPTGAAKWPFAKLAFGALDSAIVVADSANARVPVKVGETVALTDAQLRAAAVPVSGPLTDAQLRATAVPVSGPLTDVQLRAAAVPVSLPALVLPQPPVTVNATALGDTTVIAAPGPGVSLFINKGSIHNRGAATIVVALRDGTAGTIRWRAKLAIEGGGSLIDYGLNGWKLTANTALVVNLAAAGDVDINITEHYTSQP